MGTYRKLTFAIAACAAFVTTATQIQAADILRLSDSLGSRLVCTRDPDVGDVSCDTVQSGSFRVSGSFAWSTPLDISEFDETTAFSISVGNFTLDTTLADQRGGFNPRRRSAVFLITNDMDFSRPIVVATVVLSWTTRGFSVSVAGRDAGDNSLVAPNYTDSDSGPINDTLTARVAFADDQKSMEGPLRGRVLHRTARRGRGDAAEEFDLVRVAVTGVLRPAPADLQPQASSK